MKEHPLEIDVATLAVQLKERPGPPLIDCREPDEWEFCRLEGATLIPMGEIPSRLNELAEFRDQELVVYCHHGSRSLRVVHWLRQQGFPLVSSLAGGIDAWSEQVDPSVPRY